MSIILRIIFVFAMLAPGAVFASVVMSLDIDQINGQAGQIIHGKCISNTSGLDEESGRLATWTTFEVLETLKGKKTSTYTIKQIGGIDPEKNIRFKGFGIPEFTVGEEYILFLYGKSNLGFSSPVGLAQGNFTLDKATGKVSNGQDLEQLFKNLPARVSLPPGINNALNARNRNAGQQDSRQGNNKVDKTEFLDVVRQLNRP